MGKNTERKIAVTKNVANVAEVIARQQGREMEFQKITALRDENERLVSSLKKMFAIALEQKGLGRLSQSELLDIERARALIARAGEL